MRLRRRVQDDLERLDCIVVYVPAEELQQVAQNYRLTERSPKALGAIQAFVLQQIATYTTSGCVNEAAVDFTGCPMGSAEIERIEGEVEYWFYLGTRYREKPRVTKSYVPVRVFAKVTI